MRRSRVKLTSSRMSCSRKNMKNRLSVYASMVRARRERASVTGAQRGGQGWGVICRKHPGRILIEKKARKVPWTRAMPREWVGIEHNRILMMPRLRDTDSRKSSKTRKRAPIRIILDGSITPKLINSNSNSPRLILAPGILPRQQKEASCKPFLNTSQNCS